MAKTETIYYTQGSIDAETPRLHGCHITETREFGKTLATRGGRSRVRVGAQFEARTAP